MKAQLQLLFIITLLFSIFGCKKEGISSKVDSDGLTKDIRNIIPDSILTIIKNLGMPINGGENPPLLTKRQLLSATYLATQFVLVKSNRPNDVNIGYLFSDYQVTFQEQNNDNLTIKVDYVSGTESGNGLGSYIVGNDCKFSVFVQTNTTVNGFNAKFIHVISGSLLPDGIENLYFANFMIDDMGAPANTWIRNGEGRILKDKDGFSELVGTSTTWYSGLPDCPCNYSEAQSLRETLCPAGRWDDCGSASERFHYGATHEVRWLPLISGQKGQQCNYDVNGKLITGGIAAGSPDLTSPGNCGYGDFVNGIGIFIGCNGNPHCEDDVKPWMSGNATTVPCWQYLRDWPTNNTLACSTNIVNGIDHMLQMVIDMSCEEATTLIKGAQEQSLFIPTDLRNHILGTPTTLTNSELINKLQIWKINISCTVNQALCAVIDKAIANL